MGAVHERERRSFTADQVGDLLPVGGIGFNPFHVKGFVHVGVVPAAEVAAFAGGASHGRDAVRGQQRFQVVQRIGCVGNPAGEDQVVLSAAGDVEEFVHAFGLPDFKAEAKLAELAGNHVGGGPGFRQTRARHRQHGQDQRVRRTVNSGAGQQAAGLVQIVGNLVGCRFAQSRRKQAGGGKGQRVRIGLRGQGLAVYGGGKGAAHQAVGEDRAFGVERENGGAKSPGEALFYAL